MDRQMDIQMKTLIKRFEDASKNLLRLEKNILGKNNPKQHADMMQGIKALSGAPWGIRNSNVRITLVSFF